MSKTIFKYGAWATLVALLGAGASVARVLKKPKLERPDTEELDPEEIALVCLEACIEQRNIGQGKTAPVVCAGFKNFREPWARDFGFASFGLLAVGKADTVREGLRLFLTNQAPSGQLPLKFHSTVLFDRYLHSVLQRAQPNDKPLQPRFISAHGTRSIDSVLLILIAFCEYTIETQDIAFAESLQIQAKNALRWVGRYKGKLGLVKQGPFADWADSIGRKGEVLYTNVLWWRALDRMQDLQDNFSSLDFGIREAPDDLAVRIRQLYFKPEAGYLYQSPTSPVFASAPNLMAAAWGLTTKEQTAAILDYVDRHELSSTVPTQVTDRLYPSYQVGIEMWLAGIKTYHTLCSWLWIGAWHAIALSRAGREDRARAVYEKMLNVIRRDQAVFEVHDNQGAPLETRLYRSEEPLSWNAAMVLYAGSVVGSEA